MIRWANFVMGVLREAGYNNAADVIRFAASGATVYYLVAAQNFLEKRLDELQESTEYVEWLLNNHKKDDFVPEMQLIRKDREKMVAFLKSQD
ncbi:hypothetical protein MKW98_017037 [Papaver atlanticum]|uniref:Uncharacterized protein n=1 Tax=Papaver atlanticum TaxID=357466 RepID=A0AAD4TH80_9MAGN|nr:hypothetical protein MKW98_017037 [Papaver atlanticum]